MKAGLAGLGLGCRVEGLMEGFYSPHMASSHKFGPILVLVNGTRRTIIYCQKGPISLRTARMACVVYSFIRRVEEFVAKTFKFRGCRAQGSYQAYRREVLTGNYDVNLSVQLAQGLLFLQRHFLRL